MLLACYLSQIFIELVLTQSSLVDCSLEEVDNCQLKCRDKIDQKIGPLVLAPNLDCRNAFYTITVLYGGILAAVTRAK